MPSNVVDHNILIARKEQANKNINQAKRFFTIKLRSPIKLKHNDRFYAVKIKIGIEVGQNEFELDTTKFLVMCENSLVTGDINIQQVSMEQLSDHIYAFISLNYPGREVTISVEDNKEIGYKIYYCDSRTKAVLD